VLLFAAVLLTDTEAGLEESLGIVTGSVVLGLISAFLIPSRTSALSFSPSRGGALVGRLVGKRLSLDECRSLPDTSCWTGEGPLKKSEYSRGILGHRRQDTGNRELKS
jgi:hypothetical protein